ncbi:MAG: hypothetical protein WC965_02280 [Thiohalomonadaceae bacterium]
MLELRRVVFYLEEERHTTITLLQDFSQMQAYRVVTETPSEVTTSEHTTERRALESFAFALSTISEVVP